METQFGPFWIQSRQVPSPRSPSSRVLPPCPVLDTHYVCGWIGSLLQVATRKHVFLLDLHGLLLSPAPPSSPSSPLPVPLRLPDASRQAALDSLFAPLFLGSCIKIGTFFFLTIFIFSFFPPSFSSSFVFFVTFIASNMAVDAPLLFVIRGCVYLCVSHKSLLGHS